MEIIIVCLDLYRLIYLFKKKKNIEFLLLIILFVYVVFVMGVNVFEDIEVGLCLIIYI